MAKELLLHGYGHYKLSISHGCNDLVGDAPFFQRIIRMAHDPTIIHLTVLWICATVENAVPQWSVREAEQYECTILVSTGSCRWTF